MPWRGTAWIRLQQLHVRRYRAHSDTTGVASTALGFHKKWDVLQIVYTVIPSWDKVAWKNKTKE